MLIKFLIPLLIATCAPAIASDAPGNASTGGMFQVLMILILVLALMVGAAWLLKRFNVAGANSGEAIKIVGGIAVGSRERIVVVEVADQWIVVGVCSGSINALSTMPKQEIVTQKSVTSLQSNFSGRLKQFMERRNDK